MSIRAFHLSVWDINLLPFLKGGRKAEWSYSLCFYLTVTFTSSVLECQHNRKCFTVQMRLYCSELFPSAKLLTQSSAFLVAAVHFGPLFPLNRGYSLWFISFLRTSCLKWIPSELLLNKIWDSRKRLLLCYYVINYLAVTFSFAAAMEIAQHEVGSLMYKAGIMPPQAAHRPKCTLPVRNVKFHASPLSCKLRLPWSQTWQTSSRATDGIIELISQAE